jgi:hypothetical protein
MYSMYRSWQRPISLYVAEYSFSPKESSKKSYRQYVTQVSLKGETFYLITSESVSIYIFALPITHILGHDIMKKNIRCVQYLMGLMQYYEYQFCEISHLVRSL